MTLIDDLREMILYKETLEDILHKYECRIKDNTLYIYKPIPVQTFYDLRNRVKLKYDINNIIVDT